MLVFAFEAVVFRWVLFDAIVLTMRFYVGRAEELGSVDNPFSATTQDRKSMRFLWFR